MRVTGRSTLNAQLCSVGGNARRSRVLSLLFGAWHAYKPLICFSCGYLVGRCAFISNLSTLIQKSCVFKLFHTRERIQNVLFCRSFYVDLCVVVWMEGLTITIKLYFQIYPA